MTTAAPSNDLWRIEDWFRDLSPAQKSTLKAYRDELLRFNKTINLISSKTVPFVDLLHFADSILAVRAVAESHKISEIYDIGSGNGFPGLVYAILFPEASVKLVESDQRKAEFLKHAAAVLKLKNVSVLNQTFESLPAGSVQFGISRGFASIAKAIMIARKPFSKGGVYFHMKTEEWASEIAAIPAQLCSFWTPSLVKEYKLPVGEVKFAVVQTAKLS